MVLFVAENVVKDTAITRDLVIQLAIQHRKDVLGSYGPMFEKTEVISKIYWPVFFFKPAIAAWKEGRWDRTFSRRAL